MIPLKSLQDRSQQLANYYMAKKWPEDKYLDPVHGFPHLERLCDFLDETVYSLNSVVPARLIITAVCFHDIGRHMGGDHARNSAEIFIGEKLFESIRALFYAQEVKAIETAIRFHSRGLMGLDEIEKNGLSEMEQETLALTVVYDQLDTLGQDGYLRTACWANAKKVPLLPNDQNLEIVKKILSGKIKDVGTYIHLKRGDLTSHLAYNFGATDQIVAPVKNLLGLPLLRLIMEKKSETARMISNLIDFSVKKPRLS